ncbi:hypothetical protein EB820_18880 [Brevibacillus agri]|uniref:Uncharacterized protein n=1 Tax=Brevibacillus agri TaxID=51101 RepID=A0A3M8APK0_9BACL|nr:putative holin-like toxin [Brevibacillus agri]MBG9566604.1 hypothetical protein [Brevibacillus agri]QAV11370.1 hypothetical protein BA6348_00295 [Brevibacillus agri]RNB52577.1 hypothetical protein EB820_18880 [Brevibacillus agri]
MPLADFFFQPFKAELDGRLISRVGNGRSVGAWQVLPETLSLMLQFGGFLVGLLSLVVAIVVALTKRNDRP